MDLLYKGPKFMAKTISVFLCRIYVFKKVSASAVSETGLIQH